jgi:hypothetical protein
VDVIDRAGRIESRLCCHPHIWCPNEDTLAAQLLHLQHDEDAFVRMANAHPAPDIGQIVLPALLGEEHARR